MHKLAKGLKKKKKQKKGKKGVEEDEFDPEELERYRRERAEALEKASELTGEHSSTTSSSITTGDTTTSTASGSDEWKKFQALTAGIDSVLKKTQGDLDRIKSTSFYQRKTPTVEEQKPIENEEIKKINEKRYVGFDKDGNPIEQININTDDNNKLIVSDKGFVDIPDDDDDEQDDSNEEDIFDTTYIDVLQNIDVQLAYIPDSPTEEELGDDPFDTTNADKVLKTVDKKGKKVVSIGNAVEVLSGRIDHVSTCKISRPRKVLTHDLLLDDNDINDINDCDNNTNNKHDLINEPIEIEKTLLDDDTDIPDIPIDLTKLPTVLPRPVTPSTDIYNIDNNKIYEAPLDISEFELLSEKTILETIPDLEDIDNIDCNDDDNNIKLDEIDDPFAEKEPDVIDPNIEIYEASFVAATFVNEEDPFDTTFADNILPGKTELKFIEKELDELPEAEVSISLIDPAGLKRDYETGKLKFGQDTNFTFNNNKDLLGGSTSDLNKIVDLPIAPIEEIKYVDPFDTSNIQEPLPGKVELKFLEQELLSENNNNNNNLDNLDDDDFNPRKEEEEEKENLCNIIKPNIEVIVQSEEINDNFINKERKVSRPEVLNLGTGKSVGFELPTPSKRPDLLITSDEEKSISSKPLTPYYTQKSIEESLPEVEEDNEIVDVDPFDTTFVGKVAPGKTELKLIETELLKQETKLTHSTSNQDLKNLNNQIVKNIGRRQSDFGTTTVRPKSLKLNDIENSLIEDKEENKLNNIVEINKTVHDKKLKFIKRQESLLDADVVVDAKPLTPKIEKLKEEEEEEEIDISYVDPFDTSIAVNILPGKAELKQLESELSQIPSEIQKVRLPNIDLAKVSIPVAPILQDEDNFDPRAEENNNTEDFLSLGHQDLAAKVLTPLSNKEFLEDNNNIDPFDTSFASIGPGKTELKLLESELMD